MSEPGLPIALNMPRSVTRKPNPATGKLPKRPKAALTRRVTAAIDAQIFEGLSRKDAAGKAGMTEHGFYQALRKPSVLAYWNAQLEVLRTGTRARNIQRLEEIRDQDVNLGAAVRAVQLLEPPRESGRQVSVNVGINVTPGYVIDLTEPEPQTVDLVAEEVNPLIDNGDVGG